MKSEDSVNSPEPGGIRGARRVFESVQNRGLIRREDTNLYRKDGRSPVENAACSGATKGLRGEIWIWHNQVITK